MRIPRKESRAALIGHLYALLATRRDAGRRMHPFLSLSNCYPFVPGAFSVQFSTSPSPLLDVERGQEPQSQELEEDSARQIRGAILKVRNGTVEDIAHSLLCDQSCSGIQLTSPLVDGLLSKFGDDWKSALGFFRWASLHSGYKHTSNGYDKMVDILGKAKQMDRMLELVHEMSNGGLVTLDTIAKIMRRFAGARRWKDAIKFFDDLESIGFNRDIESMNLLLDTLCKEKKVTVARAVFLELKTHIPPDAHTFNIFVHGWCNARRIDEAMWTIQEMKGYGFRPSVITYSTILQAHCHQSNFRRAYEILDEMITESCPPNIITYTIFMLSLAKSGEIEEAMSLLNRVKLSGCKPDTLFYNSFISILGRAGRLQEAAHIFEVEMQRNEVPRNLSTYNTMISIFCNHCQGQNALNIFKEMESLSCRPDLYTYRPLLKLCFRSGGLDDNLQNLLSDIVNKHNLSLDLDTYTLLIHGLCKKGKIEWACLLFDEMIGREILPTTRTCQLLMYEAEQKGMNGTVERIRSLMKQI